MGALQYQCNYKKYRAWCHHYTVFERTSASRALQTKLHLFQVYWSYQSFSRWPRPGLTWPPMLSHWNVYDRSSTSDGTRMSPMRILSLTNVSSRGAVGGKAGPDGVPRASLTFHEKVCIGPYQRSKCFSTSLVPGVRHFVLGPHLCFFSVAQHIAQQAPANGCENDVVVIQFIAQFADKLKWRVEVLVKGHYFCIIKSWTSIGYLM